MKRRKPIFYNKTVFWDKLFDSAVEPRTLYLLQNDSGAITHVAFRCPCGCDSVCVARTQNVDPADGEPEAEYVLQLENKAKITLTPAFQLADGCKSRFHIYDSQAVWD